MEAGELLQATCTVSRGDDPITLQWRKDGKLIRSSPSFIINNVDARMSLLILRDVDEEHSGKYSCVAHNPVGRVEFSADLNVKGIYSLC